MTDWMWCHENPVAAAELIDSLQARLATADLQMLWNCIAARDETILAWEARFKELTTEK